MAADNFLCLAIRAIYQIFCVWFFFLQKKKLDAAIFVVVVRKQLFESRNLHSVRKQYGKITDMIVLRLGTPPDDINPDKWDIFHLLLIPGDDFWLN